MLLLDLALSHSNLIINGEGWLTLGELPTSSSMIADTRVFPSPPVVLQASIVGDDAHVDVAPAAQVVVYPRGDGMQDQFLRFPFRQLFPVAPLIHDAP